MRLGFLTRRLALGLGAALLIGGWGVIQYAHAQQQVLASGEAESVWWWLGERTRVSSWLGEGKFISGKTLFFLGAMGMGVGSGMLVVAFPRGSWQPMGG